MSPRFYLATGELSSYGFACGYVEVKEFDGIRLSMWKEHNAFHVRAYKNSYIQFWDVFDSVGLARKRYRKAIKELQEA